MTTGEVEAMFAKYTLNLHYIYPIFSFKKILYCYIIFVKSGLTPIYCGTVTEMQLLLRSVILYIFSLIKSCLFLELSDESDDGDDPNDVDWNTNTRMTFEEVSYSKKTILM